ncbi:indole-3-acetaldehyde dehydrogenase [Hymenopellis radicata]|nr:indole-3-acetaldehyde dehydrogenase [Hymenopellis radicata]
MPSTFTKKFQTPTYNATINLNTGLFINGQFVDAVQGGTIDISSATGEKITSVAAGTKEDVDLAVKAAQQVRARTSDVPGSQRGKLLSKLADLLERDLDQIAAWTGAKTFSGIPLKYNLSVSTLRYYAGWADKIQGKTIETNELKLAYTRHEPFGVVGAIVPWNGPTMTLAWKLGPALATGNTIVVKPSELTPLTAFKIAELVNEAGFPPGVVNVVNGYGHTAGQAMSEHPHIMKLAFTGSTATGRRVQEASARTNLKAVTLELGGKSPNIIFDDADLEQAVKWAASAIFANAGQMCSAGSRILVQEGVHDKFVESLAAIAKGMAAAKGDPFDPKTGHMPQVSQTRWIVSWGYINIAKKEGAQFHAGGVRLGNVGYFVAPTLMTGNNNMKAFREEIFGLLQPSSSSRRRRAIEIANDTDYGLAAAVFTENSARAIRVSHALEAGSLFVNNYNTLEASVPFGGYKASGVGRELGEYALNMYTRVKAVHVNLGMRL